jgi:AraC family transcriptional regulator, transcriptional activator of pobA
MQDVKYSVPTYKEINDFFASTLTDYRTKNPSLCCFRLEKTDDLETVYKPPFRKDFYFIGLVTDLGNTEITYDNTKEKMIETDGRPSLLNSFLVFQSPNLMYSFMRDNRANGYLIYFKKDCFSFFKPEFETEFPFFDILHTNFFRLNGLQYTDFAPHFEDVFTAYETGSDNLHMVASIKLLALLYQLKNFTVLFNQLEQGFTTPQQLLLKKFVQLVNNYYLDKRTIEEYADLLSVTPNHLSQSVKTASGKNALSFINERIITEVKTIIQFTNLDMAEIAYQMNFSDPANFGKFFKKHADVTPLEFRKMAKKG